MERSGTPRARRVRWVVAGAVAVQAGVVPAVLPLPDGAWQQWRFVDSGGGWYRPRSRHSGEVLDVSGGSTADGAAAVHWYAAPGSCARASASRWCPAGTGTARVTSRGSHDRVVNAGYRTILGFNEPDRPDRANMSVDTAVALWPAPTADPSVRIGGPAVPGSGQTWFDNAAQLENHIRWAEGFPATGRSGSPSPAARTAATPTWPPSPRSTRVRWPCSPGTRGSSAPPTR